MYSNLTILSADSLINRLRFGGDISNTVLSDGVRIEELRKKIRDLSQNSDLPHSGLSVSNGALQQDQAIELVVKPRFNPFLVGENIMFARSLLGDAIDLRRRIESLQLDIFNFQQESMQYDTDEALQANLAILLEKTVEQLDLEIASKQSEIDNQKIAVDSWTQFKDSFGQEKIEYSEEARELDHLRQGFLEFAFALGAEKAPSYFSIVNRDAAITEATFGDVGGLSTLMHGVASRDAKRSAALDKDFLKNEMTRRLNTLSQLMTQKTSLAEDRRKSISDKADNDLRWNSKAELWRRKQAQFEASDGLGLASKLADSLATYSQISGQLRSALHSIEFGQSQVFGLTIDGFQADNPRLANRYIFAPKTDVGDHVFPVKTIDVRWASLDFLALLLTTAEERQRLVMQNQQVEHVCYAFDVEFNDLQEQQTIKNLGNWPPDLLAPGLLSRSPNRKRIFGIKIINDGPAVSFSLTLKSSKLGEPALVHDPIGEILEGYPVSISSIGFATNSAAQPAETAWNSAQWINRHFDGELTMRVIPIKQAEIKNPIRVEFLVAS